jgi:glycosyltransferase involved in cell wall biosynthesis
MNTAQKPKVVVIIPSYKCAPQIPRVLAGFDQALLDRVSEVIVVNNQSPDDTVKAALEVARKIGSPKIKVATNIENVSLGGSHKVGFRYGKQVGADYVAILHGDDQAETQELNKLIDIIEAHPELDAVLGARFMKGSDLRGYNWQRIYGNKVLNLMYSIVMLRQVKDLGSGLNIFKLSALNEDQFINFGDDLGFNFDLLLYLITSKAKVIFTPITWKEEDQVSNARNFKIAKLAVTRLFKWRFGIAPTNPAGRAKEAYVFQEEH